VANDIEVNIYICVQLTEEKKRKEKKNETHRTSHR